MRRCVDVQQGTPGGSPAPPGHARSSPGHAIALAVASIMLAVGLNAGFTYWSVETSQHHWCSTLNLLYTEKPPPGNAARNPSRAYLQDLHTRFSDLRSSLGCA
jgi:hypothetical protein